MPISEERGSFLVQGVPYCCAGCPLPASLKKSNIKDKQDNYENTTIQALPKTKWAKFTYVGKQTRVITKLFKNTENTIGRILMPMKDPNYNKFSKFGVYQLICPECNKKYIGQTGRSLKKKDTKSILEIIKTKMVNRSLHSTL